MTRGEKRGRGADAEARPPFDGVAVQPALMMSFSSLERDVVPVSPGGIALCILGGCECGSRPACGRIAERPSSPRGSRTRVALCCDPEAALA